MTETLPNQFNPDRVAIVLTTHYPGWRDEPLVDVADTIQVRGHLGKEFIERAAREGYQTVVVDSGKSSDTFLGKIPTGIHLCFAEVANLALQKRLGVDEASRLNGVEIIFRIEPEKIDYLNHLPAICQPLVSGEADIVVGNRRDEEFRESYPDYGYASEMEFNRIYHYILQKAGILPKGVYFDLYSGPIAFLNKPSVVEPFLMRFKYTGTPESFKRRHLEQDGWSYVQIFGVLIGLHRGLRVTGIEIPFSYSPTQKLNEEHPDLKREFIRKRVLQRIGGLNLGIQLIRFLLNHPKNQFEEEK